MLQLLLLVFLSIAVAVTPAYAVPEIRDEGVKQGYAWSTDYVGDGISAVVAGSKATITLSTPQDIATTSGPTFDTVTFFTNAAGPTMILGTDGVGNNVIMESGNGSAHKALILNRNDSSIVDGNHLGLIGMGGNDATAPRTYGASIDAMATEEWVAGSAGGTELEFKINLSGEVGSTTYANSTWCNVNEDNDGEILFSLPLSLVTDLSVTHGGTGASTLTDHGILLGAGTDAITALGSATNGQIPIGSTGADPTLAEITGTANQITSTAGAGTITLSVPDDFQPTQLAIVNSNITWVPIAGDIETYVTNATAGDTLVLASGDFTVTDDIDITKSITIVGQGPDEQGTRILCSTTNKNVFHILSDNITITNLSIDYTGLSVGTMMAFNTDASAGNVFTNTRLSEIEINMSYSGSTTATPISAIDSGGYIDYVRINTERTSAGTGISQTRFRNTVTAEAPTTWQVSNLFVDVSEDTSANGTIGVYVHDNSATQDITVYGNNIHSKVRNSGSGTAYSVVVEETDAFGEFSNSVFDCDKTYDAWIISNGNMTFKGSITLVNQSVYGNIQYSGSLTVGDLVLLTSDLTLGADGVLLSDDSDGAITFSGLGDGYDEDFTFNLDDNENEIRATSSTGVDFFNFSGMAIGVGGTAPTNPFDACTAGQFTRDTDYLYMCVATNSWERTALITWGGYLLAEDGAYLQLENGDYFLQES